MSDLCPMDFYWHVNYMEILHSIFPCNLQGIVISVINE